MSSHGSRLDLDKGLEEYWLAHGRLSPLQRWLRLLPENSADG